MNAFSIINFKLPEVDAASDAEEGAKLVEGEGNAPPSVGAKLVSRRVPPVTQATFWWSCLGVEIYS